MSPDDGLKVCEPDARGRAGLLGIMLAIPGSGAQKRCHHSGLGRFIYAGQTFLNSSFVCEKKSDIKSSFKGEDSCRC